MIHSFIVDVDITKNSLLIPLRKIFNKHDPARVFGITEIEDEYDSEIEELLKTLKTDESVEVLSKKIYEIFVKYFDEEWAGDKSQYDKIAHEILIVLRADS